MAQGVSVGQQAYEKIRAMLAAGRWPLGSRLEIGVLADLAHVSSTPMREALHRLAAERLIDNRVGEGFFVTRPTESELRALYRWWGQLSRAAIAAPRPRLPATLDEDGLFVGLATIAREPELAVALGNAEQRLRPFRSAEAAVLPPRPAFATLAAQGDVAELRRGVARCVAARLAAVPELLDAAIRKAQID